MPDIADQRIKRVSPDSFFSGYVLIPRFFTFPQVAEWRRGMFAHHRRLTDFRAEYAKWAEAAKSDPGLYPPVTPSDELDAIVVPALLACVAEWHIAHIPAQPSEIPANPRARSSALIAWLISEIDQMMHSEEEFPNE